MVKRMCVGARHIVPAAQRSGIRAVIASIGYTATFSISDQPGSHGREACLALTTRTQPCKAQPKPSTNISRKWQPIR